LLNNFNYKSGEGDGNGNIELNLSIPGNATLTGSMFIVKGSQSGAVKLIKN